MRARDGGVENESEGWRSGDGSEVGSVIKGKTNKKIEDQHQYQIEPGLQGQREEQLHFSVMAHSPGHWADKCQPFYTSISWSFI